MKPDVELELKNKIEDIIKSLQTKISNFWSSNPHLFRKYKTGVKILLSGISFSIDEYNFIYKFSVKQQIPKNLLNKLLEILVKSGKITEEDFFTKSTLTNPNKKEVSKK